MDNDADKIRALLDQLSYPNLKYEAQRGNIESQRNLAVLLASDGNSTEAAKWFSMAAKQGDAHSQYNLGCLLLNGTGVRQDLVEAEKWFSEAANNGYINAIYNLAFMKEHGLGCEEDKAKAYQLYMDAANKGDSDSQCKLAIILLNDSERSIIGSELEGDEWPVSPDSNRAHEFLKLASKSGHAIASEIIQMLKS